MEYPKIFPEKIWQLRIPCESVSNVRPSYYARIFHYLILSVL